MAVARQSEVDQSVNSGTVHLQNWLTMLTSPFKAWRNPVRFHIGLFPISWVFHASPCAGFDACHGAGNGTGIPACGVTGRRYQAESARDGVLGQTPPRHFGYLDRIERRIVARHL